MDQPSKYRAPALEKGLSILETLAHASEPMTMSDISSALSRSRNEIFRMLQVLEEMRYVERDTAGGYALTNRLFALGMRRPPIRELTEEALPVMHELAEATNQSCHLAVMSEAEMVVVQRVEAPGLLGFAVRVGWRRPLHLSASGKTIMAFQPERKLAAILDRIEAHSGPIDRPALLEALARIRDRGQDLEESQTITAIRDISAPVLLHGEAVAALTVPFMSGAETKTDARATARLLREATATISRVIEGTRID